MSFSRPTLFPYAIVAAFLLPWALEARTSLDRLTVEVQEHAQQEAKHQAAAVDAGSADDAARAHGPKSAGFFDSFSEGESTYDEEADGKIRGVNPSAKIVGDSLEAGRRTPAEVFHESPSGGADAAFQTHYPVLQGGVSAHSGGHPGPWRVGQSGEWVQDYTPASEEPTNLAHMAKSAVWFDSGLNQLDGYGRDKAPFQFSARALAGQGYSERSSNASLTCAAAGCTASVSLQAFDGSTHEAQFCRLSLHVHPTDFDDQYSGERLDFIRVNGVTVNTDCFPMVSGCNASTQNATFSCLLDLPLDGIVNATGNMLVEAKISDVVDECPYEGNLLSAVPVVTCLVRPIPVQGASGSGAAPVSVPVPQLIRPSLNMTAPLRCRARGCIAHTEILLHGVNNATFEQCTMNVTLFQTDYDGGDGTDETVEYLAIGGANVSTGAAPGHNPCRSRWAGTPIAEADRSYVLLSSHDVTANASRGIIAVQAKISPHVDECAHEGYLLHGLVGLNCTLATAVPTSPASNVSLASLPVSVSFLEDDRGSEFSGGPHRPS